MGQSMNRNPRFFLALLASFACALSAQASRLTIGQPAPALAFTHLLQAPSGAVASWPSLRGKVVVLEFWATWCAPCVAQIPHLNALAQSLASSNVQFIAVDDEDPAVVREFLARKPIAGWVGLDTSSKILDAYGVEFRPTLFVVDTEGRIAASFNPTLLDKDQLLALAGGKSVVFPREENAILQSEAPSQEAAAPNPAASASSPAVKPLFDMSIWPGDSKGEFSFVMHVRRDGSGYYYDLRNTSLGSLFQLMAGVPTGRLVIHGSEPARKYSFHIGLSRTSLSDVEPAIQMALASAAGMRLTHASALEDAYVLQSTPKAASLLTPTASAQGSMCLYNPGTGRLTMVKTTLDGLAPRLEEVLGIPVVNEAAVPGEFDANLDLPKGDLEAIKATLEGNLGLTLVKAKRSIDRIVLDPLPVPVPLLEK
jgi:thiol-disulfide isomerase/thioredoxin